MQTAQRLHYARHIGRLRGSVAGASEGTVGFRQHPIQRDGLHHWRVFLIAKHSCVDREVAAQLQRTLRLALCPGEPMKNDLAALGWQMRLDKIKHSLA